jgi:hypothetical protein
MYFRSSGLMTTADAVCKESLILRTFISNSVNTLIG